VIETQVSDVYLGVVAGELARYVLCDDQASDDERARHCRAQRYGRIARCAVGRGARILWHRGIDTTCAYRTAAGIRNRAVVRYFDVGCSAGAWVDPVPDFGPVLCGIVIVKKVSEIVTVERNPTDRPIRLCQVKDADDRDQDGVVGVRGVRPAPDLLCVLLG
jgi:hypothetical protein